MPILEDQSTILLVLGVIYLLLLAPIIASALLLSARILSRLARVIIRRVWRFAVDKVIEMVIFGTAAFLAGIFYNS